MRQLNGEWTTNKPIGKSQNKLCAIFAFEYVLLLVDDRGVPTGGLRVDRNTIKVDEWGWTGTIDFDKDGTPTMIHWAGGIIWTKK